MVKLSPAELLSLCNAANLGIKKHPDLFKRTRGVVDRVSQWVLKTNWDDAYDRCLFIDELPF